MCVCVWKEKEREIWCLERVTQASGIGCGDLHGFGERRDGVRVHDDEMIAPTFFCVGTYVTYDRYAQFGVGREKRKKKCFSLPRANGEGRVVTHRGVHF